MTRIEDFIKEAQNEANPVSKLLREAKLLATDFHGRYDKRQQSKEFLSLFDKVIVLQCDPKILVQRMQTRTNKSGYGKTKAEQEDNVEWQKEYDPLLISLGAIPVDTEGNLDDVVNKIIEVIKTA